MKVTARGWRRDSGPKKICDFEVKDAEPQVVAYEQQSWQPDVPYLLRTSDYVALHIGPAALNLGGEYQLMLQLSYDDIIRLFLAIQPDLRESLRPVFSHDNPPLPSARANLLRP